MNGMPALGAVYGTIEEASLDEACVLQQTLGCLRKKPSTSDGLPNVVLMELRTQQNPMKTIDVDGDGGTLSTKLTCSVNSGTCLVKNGVHVLPES